MMISYLLILLNLFLPMQKKEVKYLALGDSYTIGESVAEKDRWPNQLADQLKIAHPKIIATTGWRTDDLAGAIKSADLKDEYDLVSLLIGVNNQFQGKSATQYEIEFEELLKTSIKLGKGKTKNVFVVSIPDYGFTPYGKPKQETITKQIDEFNAINKRITEKYKIAYFNITEISRKGLENPTLVAEDGLHPSGKMYAAWVDLIIKGMKVSAK
jgi:lysophospholipase L1-like esterase